MLRVPSVLVLCMAAAIGSLAVELHHGHSASSLALKFGERYSFADYKVAYGRTYADDSDEHHMREQIFNTKAAEIRMHNSQSHATWRLGVNHLTDRTEAELRRLRGYKRMEGVSSVRSRSVRGSLLGTTGIGSSCASSEQSCLVSDAGCCSGLVCGSHGVCQKPESLPDSIDWTPKLPTSEQIMDQGACGSCWALAAVVTIQMQAVINSNGTFSKILSPQGMLACTPNPKKCGGTGGCEGATPELGYEWAKNYGVAPISQQEYTAESSGGCPASFLETEAVVKPAGFVKLPENKASHIFHSLVTAGPIAVAVAANDWQSYKDGVFGGCRSKVVDHAVVLFGYGENGGELYWKIRNSWGKGWGEHGFIRLLRHTPHGDEPCGWDMDPQKGVGCEGGPKKLWVCGECGILSDVAYPVGTKVERPAGTTAEIVGPL